MDFEKRDEVSFDEYLNMITLKTSVLLAASLQLGAIIGGARESNQHNIYEFGKNLGIAFQIQDDYLDAFGDTSLIGKQIGGDIIANKKTFLMIHTLEKASAIQQKELKRLMAENPSDKVEKVLQLFRDCKADNWTTALKDKYLEAALKQLDDTAVLQSRKQPLIELSTYLIQRDK
jgi:geranylgeranyl diphosphate synthase type II